MKMTFEEIDAKLEEMGVRDYEFAYMDYETHEFGTVVEVERYGGEGKGEDWYSVQHFADHDVYICINGWYTSYDGVNFDEHEGRYEVVPKQKTITVYEAKK